MRIIPELRAEAELDAYTVHATHSISMVRPEYFLFMLESLQDVMLYTMERVAGRPIPITNVTWTVHHLYLGSDLN